MPSLPSPSNIISKLIEPLTEWGFEELPDKQCAICKDTASRPVRLSCRCSSIFCNTCLRLALTTGNDSCPFCRTVEPPITSLQQYTKQIMEQARQKAKIPRKVIKQVWIASILDGVLVTWDIAVLTALAIALALLNRTSYQDLVLLIELLIIINVQLLARGLYHFRQTSPSLRRLFLRRGTAQLVPEHPVACLTCIVSATAAVWCSGSSICLGVSVLTTAWKPRGMLLTLSFLNVKRDPRALVALQDMVAGLILRTTIVLGGIYHYQIAIVKVRESRTAVRND